LIILQIDIIFQSKLGSFSIKETKMKFNKLTLVFTIIFSTLLFGQQVERLIDEGDKFTDSYNNKDALDKYLQADKLSPKNWDILWRISRSYINIGTHMLESTSDQKDAQLAIFQKALANADMSVNYGSDKSVTYLRRAIANGRIALFRGVFSVGGVVNSVKSDCEKAIKLNNGGNYVQGLAHYVLARTNAKISEKWAPARAVLGLGWADNEIAIKEFKTSISLYPNFRMFYLDYARSLIKEDEYGTARDILNKCISSPKKDEDDDNRFTEAKLILNEIKNK
jgi:tetratricopeptide (TPR) repeat protein